MFCSLNDNVSSVNGTTAAVNETKGSVEIAAIKIASIMEKMIAFSEGNVHDIDHFIRVWTYAKTIGELENIDSDVLFVLEVAAITHDIACPLCRKKYGNTNGKHQEQEGNRMVKDFLNQLDLSDAQIERIAYLVAHHHTLHDIDGIDYQILIEADYIANATENGYSQTNAENFMQKIMNTESGKRLLRNILFSYDSSSSIAPA